MFYFSKDKCFISNICIECESGVKNHKEDLHLGSMSFGHQQIYSKHFEEIFSCRQADLCGTGTFDSTVTEQMNLPSVGEGYQLDSGSSATYWSP